MGALGKPITIVPHALRRMIERKVSRSQVERTIGAPDARREVKNRRIRVEKEFAFRKLVVIYREYPDEILVISLWPSRIR